MLKLWYDKTCDEISLDKSLLIVDKAEIRKRSSVSISYDMKKKNIGFQHKR